MRSNFVILFLGLKSLLLSIAFNLVYVPVYHRPQRRILRGSLLNVKSIFQFDRQDMHHILLPAKITLLPILSKNIKFMAFDELFLSLRRDVN
ncbi:hypothetical protein DBR40_20425 [Pedobacter sp. KBW01]|nr:hypothetical protein DBR40_20425 [Pedobacter sp. KBW01]